MLTETSWPNASKRRSAEQRTIEARAAVHEGSTNTTEASKFMLVYLCDQRSPLQRTRYVDPCQQAIHAGTMSSCANREAHCARICAADVNKCRINWQRCATKPTSEGKPDSLHTQACAPKDEDMSPHTDSCLFINRNRTSKHSLLIKH